MDYSIYFKLSRGRFFEEIKNKNKWSLSINAYAVKKREMQRKNKNFVASVLKVQEGGHDRKKTNRIRETQLEDKESLEEENWLKTEES